MALSRVAQQFAAEISRHDWSDAPYRADRAGHQRATDTHAGTKQLTASETEVLLLNVMWVTAQVLVYDDPNFDVYEYAEACGVSRHYRKTSAGKPNGWITGGLRMNSATRVVAEPGVLDIP